MTTPARVVGEPLTPELGAVVPELDARRDLDDDEVADLVDLLMRDKALFFPGQHPDEAAHARVAARLGELRDEPLEDPVAGYPGLSELDNVPFFHADWMFQTDPPKWAMLQLSELPPVGGDTIFVDLVASDAALSEPMRAFLEPLTVHHAMDPAHAVRERRGPRFPPPPHLGAPVLRPVAMAPRRQRLLGPPHDAASRREG